MIPAWMFFGQTALLILALAGWGWTIRKSMARALYMYEFGRKNGFEQGRLSVGDQRQTRRVRR